MFETNRATGPVDVASTRPVYSALSVIVRDASSLPYRSAVSYFTRIVSNSLVPAGIRSFGTRHEYPQVPSQPKGILPSETVLPEESLIVTIGSSDNGRS